MIHVQKHKIVAYIQSCWHETYFKSQLQYPFIKQSSHVKLLSLFFKDRKLNGHVTRSSSIALKPLYFRGWMAARDKLFENMIENICEIKMRGQESIDLIWRVGTRQLGFWKLSPGRMRRKGFTVLRLPNHGPHTFNVAHKSFLHLYLIITTRNGR